ncbi:MAG: hypothetical protein ACKN9T_14875 [Candidatus Methylumidiphilus sp.]
MADIDAAPKQRVCPQLQKKGPQGRLSARNACSWPDIVQQMQGLNQHRQTMLSKSVAKAAAAAINPQQIF